MNEPKIELFGLWRNTTKDGRVWYSGMLGKARVVVFENQYKKPGEKSPDLRVYLTEAAKTEQRPSAPSQEPAAPAHEDTSEIPF